MPSDSVTIKFMNGDLLTVEYDTIIYINELKTKIEDFNPQLSNYCQTLIRVSDEIVDPNDIHDGDIFAILIDEQIRISFFNDMSGYIYFENKNHICSDNIEIYTLYINDTHCMEFLHNVTNNQYTHSITCILQSTYPEYSYTITDNTIWYSSLIECVHSQPNGFPKSRTIADQLDVRFNMYHVMNELIDYM